MKQIIIYSLILACSINGLSQAAPLLTKLDAKATGIDFVNHLDETENLNYFLEDDMYNGSGVAVGDINNDGLDDIYFVSNFGADQLYLNTGNLTFENITEKAFEKSVTTGWKTAACMVDLNADGYLDIYVCRRGSRLESEEQRRNLVYINLGNGSFVEQGKGLGLDDPGRSTDAAFVDYDQDGDLDCFIVNRKLNTSVMAQFLGKEIEEDLISNKLYINKNGIYEDITSYKNGTKSYGFCFDASITDLNGDGWPDVYITNDYDMPDFLLINDKQGGFKNEINKRLRHTSQYSMGSDMADFNNDGLIDLFILDMSNTDYAKSKTNMGSMSVADFWDRVRRGYPYQYMYNTLQLNLGQGYFSDIAHMAGVASSDWSWGPLVMDIDQDGLKDLFITNGVYREVRDQDFTTELKEYIYSDPESFDTELMLAKIPQTKEVNYFFKNKGDLTFDDVSKEWGMDFGSISHGSAYSDLDNDGDLDLVVNTVNEPAMIIENNGSGNNYLKVNLSGEENNTKAIGAKVTVKSDLGSQLMEVYPSRGYCSSSSYTLCFGLNKDESISEIRIDWNAKEHSILKNVKVNQTLIIDYKKAEKKKSREVPAFNQEQNVFVDIKELPFNDFKREILIPHKMSQLGPFMSTGDANNDAKDDMFIGGGVRVAARLLVNIGDQMMLKRMDCFLADADYEDGQSVFFDADMDGDQDLYVVSGGNEFPAGHKMYQDRLYINIDGKEFKRDTSALPAMNSSGQCVIPNDFDMDGDIDLLVPGRQVPGKYPMKPRSYWLVNEGGKFTDKIEEIAPELQWMGMITDAEFTDLNGDGKDDLIIVGEWMPITFMVNSGGSFEVSDRELDNSSLYGWWNCIEPVDVKGDGQLEFIVGNLGLNNKFHPNPVHGLQVYLEDFDENGTLDIVLSKFFGGIEHPIRGKECLSDQMPNLSEKFKTFNEFATAEFGEMFKGTDEKYSVNNFANGILVKNGDIYEFKPFPSMGQIGPINDVVVCNVNGDDYPDFVAVGNRYEAEIETPRYDGNPGLAFLGKGNGEFEIQPIEIGGGFANKNAKDALLFQGAIYISNAMESVNRIQLFFE